MTVSIAEMENELLTQFHCQPAELQEDFKNCTEQALVGYHHTLGQHLRNHFRLWERKWEPEIVNGVDRSPDHPDTVSMQVIHNVWKKVNGHHIQ